MGTKYCILHLGLHENLEARVACWLRTLNHLNPTPWSALGELLVGEAAIHGEFQENVALTALKNITDCNQC